MTNRRFLKDPDVATIAFDTPDEAEAPRLPISAHPAFPGLVALWFAALLGVGSLILPVTLLEYAVDASGLPSLLPAAHPPLGSTARVLIAVAAALGGAALGLIIARRVAAAQAAHATTRSPRLSDSRRPINAHEELDTEGLASVRSQPITRLRAVAISENHDDDDDGNVSDDHPLDLCDVAEEPEPAPASVEDTPQPLIAPDSRPLRADAPVRPFDAPGAEFASGVTHADEPLPFAAPSLSRQPEPERDAAPSPVEPRADWQTGPLHELGLVQLVQRLGSSIERRRQLATEAATQRPPVTATPLGFEPAPADEAAQAMAAYFGSAKPAQVPPSAAPVADAPLRTKSPPNMLRPADLAPFEELSEYDESFAPETFSLPLRSASAPSGADDEEDDGYGSLLGLSKPFMPEREPLLRAEAEEANEAPVELDQPGPAHSPAPAADADAALRAALATLQRMSSTAG